MAAEEDFVLSFTGEETDNLLKHTESMKNQTTEEDGETVQVYDTNGVPHKVSKTELLKKSTLALPELEDISAFVAVNAAGNAIGLMTKEQVASVLAGLTVRKMELGWLTGYTKLTDYADFGTMLIYITGDNRQSLIMLCDIQRVIMLHDEHRDDELAVYRKEDGGYYLYTASYNLYAYIISSSFTLSIVKGQDGNGLIKINRA
jgi:hypothetical protein